MARLSYTEAAKRMGPAMLTIEGLRIKVDVIDYQPSYGSDRWTVTPVHGTGRQNVEAGRLQWLSDTNTKEDN